MTAHDAETPAGDLFRIARWPDPLALPPREFCGDERFDDPLGIFRVLYAGTRLACFVEWVAAFRLPLALLAQVQAVEGTPEPLPQPRVAASRRRQRCIGRLRPLPGQRWLDLRQPATAESLRAEFAPLLGRLGLPDLDVSGLRGGSRPLTQAIARWAYEQGYQGLAYRSRFRDDLDCWALFEGAAFERSGPPQPIAADDPDLRAAAALFGLLL
ncbi:MAG: RES family NAD+ phosphorylase [Chloroflexota bacterium]